MALDELFTHDGVEMTLFEWTAGTKRVLNPPSILDPAETPRYISAPEIGAAIAVNRCFCVLEGNCSTYEVDIDGNYVTSRVPVAPYICTTENGVGHLGMGVHDIVTIAETHMRFLCARAIDGQSRRWFLYSASQLLPVDLQSDYFSIIGDVISLIPLPALHIIGSGDFVLRAAKVPDVI